MKRLFILMMFVTFFVTAASYGQQLKYSEIKDEYTVRNYREKIDDNPCYSPLLAGVLNIVFPSAGYYYINETARGLMVFGGELLAFSVSFYGIAGMLSAGPESALAGHNAQAVLLTGVIASNILYLWSVFDVVQISKLKNLAIQDRRQNLSLRINPDLSLASFPNQNFPVVGARLSITF